MQPQTDPQPIPAPVTAEVAPTAARQEVELWWGGYAARTMLPSLAVCLLLTVAMIGTAAYLSSDSARQGTWARWWAYHFMLLLWLVQTLRWAYRVASYEYRLTSHRLYCLWGPLRTPGPPITLTDIQSVQVQQNPWDRWLGVGWILIESNRGAVPLVLFGVRNAENVARTIRHAAERSREPAPALPVP